MGKPFFDGLGLGDGRIAMALTLLIVGIVAYLSTIRERN